MKFPGGAVTEIFSFLILAVPTVLILRFFIAQPFVVEGESMHPTFESGDYLIVDELSYRFHPPHRGDVIVFRYPGDPKIFYIKRVVGLPGETIHIEHGKVMVTKTDKTTITLDESYVVAEDATYTENSAIGPEQYFVMGDNRPRSSDSRIWGLLPSNDIVGRAFLRLLPAAETAVFPGATIQPQ